MVASLDQYGTAQGLEAWTLDATIANLVEEDRNKVLARARRMLEPYGPFDESKQGFGVMVTEMVYHAAEVAYYAGQAVQAMVMPYRSERIGSYSYDRGSASSQRHMVKDNPILWAFITYLRDNRKPMHYTTRVDQLAPVNPETGVRDIIIGAHTNRVARAVERHGFISDTEEFNKIVYGDLYHDWGW